METYHILVVEDDFKARNKLAYRLEYAGYRVTQAPDGETAISMLQTGTFDVVLTDIVMGNVGGLDVLHTARQISDRPSVILLTGHGALETCMDALRSGVFDYLLKPCSPEQLLSCIERAIERRVAEQKLREVTAILSGNPMEDPSNKDQRMLHTYHIGGLTVGHLRKDVFVNNRQISLTPLEYALLRYLAEHTGLTCSLQDIVQYTHGIETNDQEAYSLLKTHIRNLRKKISPEYIVNERSKGYRLVVPPEENEEENIS